MNNNKLERQRKKKEEKEREKTELFYQTKSKVG
jgi:hypothetical protein